MEAQGRTRGGWQHGVRNANPRAVSLTVRDLCMLYELYCNRFMDTRQLQALYGDKVDDRLRRLFDAGYVDWPEAQVSWRHPGVGSRPNVWALNDQGAAALVTVGFIDKSQARKWAANNRRVSKFAPYLPHTLLVNQIKVAFRVACRARELSYIPGDRLVKEGSARTLNI